MRYTPVDLRHVDIGRALFGFDRAEVKTLIDDVADSFEDVWRERGELADRLDEAQKALGEVKQREGLLAATLVAAEKTAAEAVENAKRQAELIIAEAHNEARSITRSGQSERERLFIDVRRVETLLRGALGMIEETRQGLPARQDEPSGELPAQSWPNRQDTREFAAVSPPAALEPGPESEHDDLAASEPAKLPPVQELVDETDGDDAPHPGRDFSWG
jgi:cell division septum initiation protein DivIVA